MKIVSIEWLTDEITEQLNNEETCYLSSDKEYWLFTDDNVFNKISKEFHFDETIKNREYPIYSISVTEWLHGKCEDNNDEIMKAIRQRMGLNEDDTSSDEEIMKLDKYDVFRQYCLWNGLMGSWYDTLLSVVENIYGVELKEEI